MNIAFDIMFGKMTKQLSTEFGKRQHYRTELSSLTAATARVCGGRCMEANNAQCSHPEVGLCYRIGGHMSPNKSAHSGGRSGPHLI